MPIWGELADAGWGAFPSAWLVGHWGNVQDTVSGAVDMPETRGNRARAGQVGYSW
jgi:hypothetical protein